MSGFDLGLDAVANKFRHVFSPQTIKFSDDDEYEIKYMAADGLATFSKILKTLPHLEFERSEGGLQPRDEVFLLSPEFFYKDYSLANFGLDTVNEDGTAKFDIYANGHQLRQRFSIRAYLPEAHDDAIGVSQCSVKNLYSNGRLSNRLEIEKCMPGMAHSAPLFIKAEKNRLPGFFSEVASDKLRVSTAFMTTRGSYLMGVYLAEENAIVAFEVSNDQTMNLTPDLTHVTRAYAHEWEPEAKQIFFLKDKGVAPLDPRRDADFMFFKSEQILRSFVQRHLSKDLLPARKSKLERAMDDSHKYYESMKLKFNTVALGENLPKPGAHYALGHNITMAFIEREKRRRLLDLAGGMTSAQNLINVPGIAKHRFDVRAAERPVFAAYA